MTTGRTTAPHVAAARGAVDAAVGGTLVPVTADDVLAILDRLDASGIDWWLDGGWGVDALLGDETRPHDDLDLVVRRDDIERLAAVFPEFARADHDWWPARFVLRDAAGRQIDFHPVAFDNGGDAWQELVDGSRVCYAAADLGGRGRVGGREVRCITPELQMQHHVYESGGPDDVDWDDVRVLSERFALVPPPHYETRPGFVEAKRTRARPRGGDATTSGADSSAKNAKG